MSAPQRKLEKAITKAELEVLLKKVATLASQKPDKAAFILSQWMHASSIPKNLKKKIRI